jgi:hypothetical protein
MATTKPTTRKSLAEEVDSKEQMHRLCLQLSRKIERSLKDDFQIRRVDAETLDRVWSKSPLIDTQTSQIAEKVDSGEADGRYRRRHVSGCRRGLREDSTGPRCVAVVSK